MKKSILTHAFAFALGCIITYIVADFAQQEAGVIKNDRLKAKNLKSNKENSADLVVKSLANVLDRQLGDMARELSGINIYAQSTKNNFKIFVDGAGIDKESLEIDVDGNLFKISGVVLRESRSGNQVSTFKSSFKKSFSIPRGYDTTRPNMVEEDGKIVIEFNAIEI
jgi:HSP20 family molecular chaperone IbpA